MKNSRGGDRDDRGFAPKTNMHDAICAECGKKCQVPFFPKGGKPVYCSDCFENVRGSEPRRSDDRDRGFRRDNFRERDRGDRRMYTATCDKCKKSCQVPFQPTPGKPVFCDACFGKDGGVGAPKNDQLTQINIKLDKILNALACATIRNNGVEPKKVPLEKVVSVKTAAVKVAPVKEIKKKAVKKVTTPKKNSKK